jgi:hypothetical protein
LIRKINLGLDFSVFPFWFVFSVVSVWLLRKMKESYQRGNKRLTKVTFLFNFRFRFHSFNILLPI